MTIFDKIIGAIGVLFVITIAITLLNTPAVGLGLLLTVSAMTHVFSAVDNWCDKEVTA